MPYRRAIALPDPTAATLRRELGLVDAVAIGLGAIIGAGIFVVTGIAAGVAGPAFLVGLVLAGGVATCNALSSAELAARYPQAGGTYEYGYQLLSPSLGFSAGWMFLASKLAAGGVVALGFGHYLAALFPGTPPSVAAIVATAVLTAANSVGIRKAGRLNTGIVTITVAGLIAFILVGSTRFRWENLTPFAPAGLGGMLQSAALLFFAYTGYARLATLGEEVRDPERTIPRAIVLALAAAGGLYVFAALVCVGAIGAAAMAASGAPLQAAARTFPLPAMDRVVSVAGTTAMLGVLLSQILGISRMLFAMARRGDLPRFLAHVHPRYGVPDRGILLTGAVIAATAWFGTLRWIVAAATFTILLYYAITNLAALRLRPEARLFPPWIAGVGLISCLLLAAAQRWETIAAGVVLLMAGYALRSLCRIVAGE